jgi:heme exporter protein B
MPSIFSQIYFLIQKEFLLEWRQKYALGGILLYVFSTVFIVFISSQETNSTVWNTLFWIVILFASVNAVVKSFVQESGNRTLYYYTLLSPIAVLLAKMIYNLLLLSVVSILTYAAFALFISNPVQHVGQFILATFLGASGFAIALTFIAAIASKANNSSTLMAILGFPVIIPILFTVVRLSEKALEAETIKSINDSIAILSAIDLILLAMALLLFPFLWRQ